MSKFFDRFSVFDLVILALMAALGVAIKPFVNMLAHLLTGPLLIPAGTVAGGIYMLFPVLGAAIVGKRGAATLLALVQAIMVLVTGILGTHGLVTLLTYTAPGLAIDFLWLLMRHRGECSLCCFFGGLIANIVGTFGSNLVFFRLSAIPLLVMLITAALFGGLGGFLAWNIRNVLVKYKLTGRGSAGSTGI